jgi:hypothetical protein
VKNVHDASAQLRFNGLLWVPEILSR